MEEAGSLPFVALTSWRGLVDTAGLSSSTSKRIFINGGSGTLLLVPTFFVLSLRAKINCVCVCVV